MKREEVLLQQLAKDTLAIYFSGASPQETYRRLNTAVSRYLDGCDTMPLYKESDSVHTVTEIPGKIRINSLYGKMMEEGGVNHE